ncbi:MAG: phosphoribosylformylglycinamidine synthase I [Candidatus Cloacimonetes bacterium]|nr:phosphoribosylformylglycinamidine synthase I [Candidatus Cloacimonadota bacterium]
MKVSVITFPGTNCDHDTIEVFSQFGDDATLVWHQDRDLKNPDLVVFAGGSAYGDYLRGGALAKYSPVVAEVIEYARKGGMVLGLCNGFQILTECGLLPGTLMINIGLDFICEHRHIRVEHPNSPWTHGIAAGTVLDIPIAHKEGNFHIDAAGLQELEDNERVLFRYSDEFGNVNTDANPNGSLNNIAGICSANKRVLGMMPHPERAAFPGLKSQDGTQLFKALQSYFAASG